MMIIKRCSGYELEKAKSNTSEDFFNRSEVTYIEDGEEKTLHVLYVRYFDEMMDQFTPFQQDPIFQAGEREITIKDLVAIACFLRNPELKQRKRIYINSEKEFASLFNGLDFNKLENLLISIEQKNGYEVRSPLEFIIQPA
jgi:hypothetical protein